ncbi:MAG: Spy/CpxP family protein refolding chaperone [Candidatus Latescibacterota bacterium]
MMAIRRLSVFTFIIALICMAGTSDAQTRRSTPRRAPSDTTGTQRGTTEPLGSYFNFYLDYSKQLNLTQNQVKELESRREQFLKETQGQRDSLRTAWEDIQKLLEQPNVDQEQISRRIQESSELMGDLLNRAVTAHIEAQSVLEPKQREMANQYVAAYLQQFIASSEGMTTRGRTGGGAGSGTAPGSGSKPRSQAPR